MAKNMAKDTANDAASTTNIVDATAQPAQQRAPWLAAQRDALLAQRGHAWLLHGPSGLGQYQIAMSLVQAWLSRHRASCPPAPPAANVPAAT